MSSKTRGIQLRFLEPTLKIQATAFHFGILALLESVVDLTVHVMGSCFYRQITLRQKAM
jgi:hypothetical protein